MWIENDPRFGEWGDAEIFGGKRLSFARQFLKRKSLLWEQGRGKFCFPVELLPGAGPS